MKKELYHVGDTKPMDVLLFEDNEIVDPSGATSIKANVRIGTGSIKFTKNNLSVVTDDEGNKRVRMGPFAAGDLDPEGDYQIQVHLTWPDYSETTPTPHKFKVVPVW